MEILSDVLDTFENLVLKFYKNTTYGSKYLSRKVMEEQQKHLFYLSIPQQ